MSVYGCVCVCLFAHASINILLQVCTKTARDVVCGVVERSAGKTNIGSNKENIVCQAQPKSTNSYTKETRCTGY